MLDIVYVGIERVYKNAAIPQDSRVNREDKCLTIITIFHRVWSSASNLGSQGLFYFRFGYGSGGTLSPAGQQSSFVGGRYTAVFNLSQLSIPKSATSTIICCFEQQ